MRQQDPILGVDFGTSNSAAGYLVNGNICPVMWPSGETSLPTTFFFDFDTQKTLIGEPANEALLTGADGRFMRALKRVLGTSLMHEKRQIFKERVTFVEIIGRFLAEIKARAEAQSGETFERALSGRPVVFHGTDDPREAKAEADLRACYEAAGFKDVHFMAEPAAAAVASDTLKQTGEVGLIVDIGGGTSDFSLFRSGKEGVEILANYGVRIGGTDFDRAISIDRVMPLMGAGTQLRKMFGAGTTPAPVAIFNDLATWEKIPFLYTGQNQRMVKEMVQLAQSPQRMKRLSDVLEHQLGHDLAFAVERGKIAANSEAALAQIALDEVEAGLSADLASDVLNAVLTPHAAALAKGAEATLKLVDMEASAVDRVIYVGGSSLMAMVSDVMKAQFPQAEHSFTDVFAAVTNGLVLASAGLQSEAL